MANHGPATDFSTKMTVATVATFMDPNNLEKPPALLTVAVNGRTWHLDPEPMAMAMRVVRWLLASEGMQR